MVRWRRLAAIALVLPVATTALAALAAPAAFAATTGPDATTTVTASSDNAVTAPAPPQPDSPVGSVDDLEAQMLGMINAERAAAGVGAVQQIAWAHTVARQHSQEMAAAGDIWHNIAGFIDKGRSAMGASYLGENVAMDSTLAANDALLYSDVPHRDITLNARFNYVGLGIALDSRNWVYVTEDFAQIAGGASQRTAAAITKPVAQPTPAPKPAAPKAPVVKAPVVKAPVAVATAKPPTVKPPVVAPVVAVPAPAAVAAVAVPAPAVAPAAPAVHAQAAKAVPAKAVSHSSRTGIVWMLVAVEGLLVAALAVRRFGSMLRTPVELGHAPTSA